MVDHVRRAEQRYFRRLPAATGWIHGQPRTASSTVRRVSGASIVTLELDALDNELHEGAAA